MQNLRRNYIKTISLLVPLYSDNLLSLLSPILGQYGIQVSDFISKVNKETRLLNSDVTVKVQLTLFANSLYSYSVALIGYNTLVHGLASLTAYTTHDVYKLILLYSLMYTKLNTRYLKINYLNFRGYLNSYNL